MSLPTKPPPSGASSIPPTSSPGFNPHSTPNFNPHLDPHPHPTPVIDTGVHTEYDPLGDMSESLRSALSAVTDVFSEAGGMVQAQTHLPSGGQWSTRNLPSPHLTSQHITSHHPNRDQTHPTQSYPIPNPNLSLILTLFLIVISTRILLSLVLMPTPITTPQ